MFHNIPISQSLPRVSHSVFKVSQSHFTVFNITNSKFHNTSFTIRPASFTIQPPSFTIKVAESVLQVLQSVRHVSQSDVGPSSVACSARKKNVPSYLHVVTSSNCRWIVQMHKMRLVYCFMSAARHATECIVLQV